MDISDMIGRGKKPEPVDDLEAVDLDDPTPEDDPQNDIPVAEPGMKVLECGPELTGVDRIKAYRDGSLALPMVGRIDNDNEQIEVDEGASDDSGVDRDDAEDGEGDRSGIEDDADIASENGAKSLTGFPGLRAGRRLPRRALMIGVPAVVALVVAGVVVPELGHHQSDQSSGPAAGAKGPAAGKSTTTRSAELGIPDTVIKPVSAGGPEYPISVTPPMDAFSGEKGKGWICAGLYGTVLTVTLPGPTAISEIDLLPGIVGTDADGSPLWAKHQLVSKVAFGFDYGDPVYADYADKQQMQPTTFHNVISKVITITILEFRDISGKGPGAGSAAPGPSNSPGILGDLGSIKLDPAAPSAPASQSDSGSRPPTFAIGAIQIMGHTPS